MPSEELLCTREVELTISVADLISQPGLRVTCACCGEEIINGREARLDGRILCRTCAGGDYYRSVELKANAPVAALHGPRHLPRGRLC
jgi:formylmethanofuran dehydrogenase subunit E